MQVSTALILVSVAAAEDPAATTQPSRPIAASLDRLLKRLEDEAKVPCRQSAEDEVPCFPVLVEARAPEFSVAASLGQLLPEDSPSPSRPPTAEELRPHRPGPVGKVVNFIEVDPTCVAKSALKTLKGKNDVYYLYRVWDRSGERVALQDKPLDPAPFSGVPEFRFEFLGKFDGECEAVAAYRRAQRAASARPAPDLRSQATRKDDEKRRRDQGPSPP